MADFSAPTGPPPPKVPEGWIARWNDQYKEWFYVNTFTKKSQWDKPTAPAVPDDGSHRAPDAPPPSYSAGSNAPHVSDSKNNPFATDDHVRDGKPGGPSNQEAEDERLARQLQEEEDARARSARPGSGQSGAAASYASTPLPPGSSAQGNFPDQLPPRDGQGGDKSRGLLGKIFGGRNKNNNQYGGQPQYGGYGGHSPQPPYGGGYGPPPQQGYGYGGPPPGAYGAGYGGGYGGPPPGGYYGGGYPQQQQQPSRFGGGGGGLGGAGGLALGAGAGLLGGMVIGDMISDHNQEEYQQGYDQGQNADDGGGGGDYGGGDGGGDMGGGDF